MRVATLALAAALPAALAQCPADACSDAVNALLGGGAVLSKYAYDLCSSAIATTKTTTVAAPSESAPTAPQYGGSRGRKDKRAPRGTHAPSWASGCEDHAEFASACQCASVVPGTTTVTVYSSSSSAPAASSLPVSSSVLYPNGNTSTYPSGFSTGVPLTALPGTALPTGIQFMPESSIVAEPTGPTTLETATSTSSEAPYTSSNFTIPTGFSTGVPLSSLPGSSLPGTIMFVPAAAIAGEPTGPTTLVVPTSTSSSSSSSISIPSGFSSGVPLSSSQADSIAFVPEESVTADPSGPSTLPPKVSPSATTNSMLPGATAAGSAVKAKRNDAAAADLVERDPSRHTPCPPRQVKLFFDLLTHYGSPDCS